jgi:hypothetical protein
MTHSVIPSERSESRDLHLGTIEAAASVATASRTSCTDR